MIETSGELVWSEVEGAHRVDVAWWCDTGIVGQAFALTEHGRTIAGMSSAGRLFACVGYMYDGSSGPTIDGDADPVPALPHDIAYEGGRRGKLHQSTRGLWDDLYYRMLRERGMSWLRARNRWMWLRIAGGSSFRRTQGPEYTQHHSQ